MNVTNIIRGVVNATKYTVTAPIIKEDYGLYLKIEGLDLPTVYEVDFSNSENSGSSVTMVGNADGVLIPRQFIKSGQDVFAFLFWNGEDFGRTVYKFKIPNKLRPDRTEEQPTPEEQSVIDQSISALNSAVEQTAEDVETTTAKAAEATSAAATATQKASEATESAQSAGTYATRAESAMQGAETARTASQQSATASATSAEQAAGSALTASTKAGDASASATSAAQSAIDARNYKDAANLSAESASGYAGSASDSATTATEQATIATNKASESAQSALDATTAKEDAVTAKTAAEAAQALAEDARDGAQRIVGGIVMIEDTATGAVASFPDGADDIPMKSLKVAIDPVQDLHGQESPYPAGGGKNLLPIDKVFHDDSTGNITIFDGSISGTYTISIDTSGVTSSVSPDAAVCSVTVDGTIMYYISLNNTQKTYTGTITKIVVFSASSYTKYRGTVKFQLESGSTATAWTPYSNICPITGWTGAQVMRTGKNLLTYTPDKIAAPLVVTLDKSRATLVKKGVTYTMSFDMQNATTWRICAVLFDLEGNRHFIDGENPLGSVVPFLGSNSSGQYYVWGANYTYKSFVITPIDDFYAMFFFLLGDTSASTVMVNPMLEIGSTPTSYEPYTGNAYNISWETEAGTVYGGTLDVVSGELVVDRYFVDSTQWTQYNANNGYKAYKINDVPYGLYNSDLSNDPLSNMISEFGNFSSSAMNKNIIQVPRANTNIAFMALREDIDPTLVELTYLMSSPQTYHLTPTEVRTLLGQNNVWADTGNSTVEYYADTKRYIDKRIAELG